MKCNFLKVQCRFELNCIMRLTDDYLLMTSSKANAMLFIERLVGMALSSKFGSSSCLPTLSLPMALMWVPGAIHSVFMRASLLGVLLMMMSECGQDFWRLSEISKSISGNLADISLM